MAERHPLAEKLARFYRERKSMSADQLEHLLFDIQDGIEDGWETGEFQKMIGPEEAKVRTCARDGCNDSRYPLSTARFCIFDSSGHSSYAAAYRNAKARDHR